jgi:hypothetical protein
VTDVATHGGAREGTGRPRQPYAGAAKPTKPRSQHYVKPKGAKAKSSGMTAAQSRWLAEHSDYEIVQDGREYRDLGVLTIGGGYFGGSYDIRCQPKGYLAVGIRQLTADEKRAEAQQRERERKRANERRRAERRRNDPQYREKWLAQRRGYDRAHRQDAEWLARERERNRLKMQALRANPQFLARERERERMRRRERRAKNPVRDQGNERS